MNTKEAEIQTNSEAKTISNKKIGWGIKRNNNHEQPDVGAANKKALEEKLSTGKYVLFFTADWCPDCRFIKPAMPEIEANFSQFEFILVDRDENIDLCQEMMIMGIPSFVVYEDGKEKARFVNKDRKTKKEVEDFLNNI